MATTFSRSKFGPDEPRRTPTNSGELRSSVISEIWSLVFSWPALTYHKATHSAWMPKFLPSCYQQGRGQGHTLCSRNPLFPTNHVAREKSQWQAFGFPAFKKPATNGCYDMLWFGVTPYPAPITNGESWSSSGLFFVNLTLAQLVEIWSPVYHLVIIATDIHLFLERGTPAGPPNCVVSSMFLSTLCVIYCYFI